MLTFDTPAGTLQREHDAVVLTLPFPVLREVDLQVDAATHARLAPVADELRFFFITSRFDLKPVPVQPADGGWIHAVSTAHGKCVRCWHYRADVGSHADDPGLCGRCVENVNGAGESRRWF